MNITPRVSVFFSGATTLSITTVSITTLSVTTLCLKGLYMTLSMNDTQQTHTLYFADCHCAHCRILFTVKLSVGMLNVVMLSVVAPENLYSKNWRICPCQVFFVVALMFEGVEYHKVIHSVL